MKSTMAPHWRNALKLNSSDTWDPSHRFATSWLLAPWVLFAVRAVFALYAFTTLFFIIGWQASGHDGYDIHDVHKSFSYFTVLCYWGQAIYFLLASTHTFAYAHHGQPLVRLRTPPFVRALYSALHTTATVFPFLVTLVFWSILYPSHPLTARFDIWTNTSQHALNAAFALCEILAARTAPAPWVHLLWCVLVLGLYCGLAFVTKAVKGYYVYPFLDPRPKHGGGGVGVGRGAVVGYCVGVAVGVLVVFCVVRGVVWVRVWGTERRGRGVGVVNVQEVELEAQRGVEDK